MNYTVIPTKKFESEFKRHNKKHKGLEREVSTITDELKKGHFRGDIIPGLKLPNNDKVFKVRFGSKQSKLGKSGGFRLLYYVITQDKNIYLITMYSKSDKITIPHINPLM